MTAAQYDFSMSASVIIFAYPLTEIRSSIMTAIATQRLQIYKCAVCGNIVELIHAGGGTLTCCDQPMKLFVENTVDAAREKHVPVVERTPEGIIVRVGSVAHPMEEKHYIEWIEVITGDITYRQFLHPGDAPEAEFPVTVSDITIVRAYCNLHGLWKGEGA